MKKQAILSLIFLLLSHLSFGQLQKNWTWGGPLDPLQQKFKVLHYQLDLEIFPESQLIQGSNKVRFYAEERLDTLRLDLIAEYQVSKVIMDGKEIRFDHVGDVLDIFPNVESLRFR